MAGEPRPMFAMCSGIFVLALVVRLALALVVGSFHLQPDGEMFAVARSIATDGVFGNPGGGAPSGPTAHVAPVYPYYLALLLRVTSTKTTFPPLVAALNIGVASLVWSLLPLTAQALGLPGRIGALGGVVGALSPIRHYVELNGYWEPTLAGLVIMALVVLTFGRRYSSVTPLRTLLTGAGWGVACLLQPASVTVFAVVIMVTALNLQAGLRTRWAALTLFAFVLTLAPWTIRNYRTFGGLMFVRGNLGVELSVSNNDGALPSHENVLRNALARHPHVSATEFARRNQMGELQYDRGRLNEALTWIARNPARFAKLTADRVRLFWVPERSRLVLSVLEWTLTAFACMGVAWLYRSRSVAAPLLAGIWTVYPLLYYIIQADERYRYPIEWSIVLVAAAGGWSSLESLSRAAARRTRGDHRGIAEPGDRVAGETVGDSSE